MNTTVVNSVKDRSKYLRLVGDPHQYEYGWVVYNRRDRTKDYFNKVGEGTYEDARAWMDSVGYTPEKHHSVTIGPDK